MKISIRWKLFASYVVVVIVTVAVIYGYLSHVLEDHLTDDTREKLADQAAIASFALGNSPAATDFRQAPLFASELARRSRARVTVVAPDGTVVGDSDIPPDRLPEVENHLARPEIQRALSEGTGSSIRYSSTLRREMLYVAAPVRFPVGNGAIRLALPLTVMERLKQSLQGTLWGALGFAGAVSLLMTVLFSLWLFRLIRGLKEFAEELGSGHLSRRMPVRREDELGALAQAMNGMAVRLQEQMDRIAADRNRLDAMLHGMGEGVIMTDKSGMITLVNPAFRSLLHVHEDLTGRALIDVSRHPALNDSFRAVVETRAERIEEICIPQPMEKTVLIHWVPLFSGEQLTGVIAVFHDITDLKRLEKIRKDFVANVSHELRTPVTVIKGYAETLLDGALTGDPADARRFIEVILAHSDRLASLITDLLSLSEMESGSFCLDMREVNLDGVVTHAVALLEMKAREKNITVDVVRGEVNVVILGDRGRLEQVFINLLDNGIKYTPAGGSITVALHPSGEQVEVVVSDTGIGIPSTSLPRIFERFYRVDPSRSRAEGGTGLGLAIVKHIVQLHGGSVRVESELGKGTSFLILLPRMQEKANCCNSFSQL